MLETTCCFLGHRKIKKSANLESALKKVIEDLIIEAHVDTFLFGSKSQFNDLCYTIVCALKEKYPHIKLVYVRAEYPYINDDYKEYLLLKYDETYFPDSLFGVGSAVYVKRNYEMIDRSSFCIVYYNETYVPAKSSYKPSASTKSGTKIAYDYARKKRRKIINVYSTNNQ